QRAYAIRKDKIVSIFSLSGIGWIFVPSAVGTLAFVAIGLQKAPEQVNQVAPFIAEVYGGGIAKWAFLIGVWAALASTIAALINALAALIVNDVYLKMKPKTSEKQQIKFVRMITIIIGIVAMLFSLPETTTMLGL